MGIDHQVHGHTADHGKNNYTPEPQGENSRSGAIKARQKQERADEHEAGRDYYGFSEDRAVAAHIIQRQIPV